MFKSLVKSFQVLISVALVFQLAGCGTILHPERKGQKGGKIDLSIALLDGIGLLFFFIPGVIAYAVDFNNGTIYLPGGPLSSLDVENIKEVKFDPKASSLKSIERTIKNETGYDVKGYRGEMQIVELKSSEDMLAHFKKASKGMQNVDVVLLNN